MGEPMVTNFCRECEARQAEIERLRSLVESYRVNFENEVIVRRQTQIENEELRVEIERLEDALSNAQQEIARIEDDHERLTLKGVNND